MQVGGALGVAIIGSLLATRYWHNLSGALSPYHVPHAVQQTIRGSLGGALAVAGHLGGVTGHLLAELAHAAFISGMDLGLLAGACVVLAGGLFALIALPSTPSSEPIEAESEVPTPPMPRVHSTQAPHAAPAHTGPHGSAPL